MARPPSPQNYIKETIGLTAWKRLIAWRGGTEYDVPTSSDCPRGIELASRIGLDGTRKLISFAGGTRIYIAAGHAEILLSRYQEIMALRKEGKSPREIALMMTFEARYTERTVRQVLSGRYEDFERQFGQFDDKAA